MEWVGRVMIFHFTELARSLLCKALDRNDSYGAGWSLIKTNRWIVIGSFSREWKKYYFHR